ncbi:DUF4158 domain-containing protein, partial [Leisingera sp. MMG025]|nr:DUF4158 domain-containing protein [Leisingera sp. MMG026]
MSFQDMDFLSSLPQSVCLEVALQTCSARCAGRFVEDWANVDDNTVDYVASQLDMQAIRPHRLFSDRAARRYRLEIAKHLGLSRTQANHRAVLEVWLRDLTCPNGGSIGDMLDQCYRWFRERRLLPPAEGILARSVRTAWIAFVDGLLAGIARALPPKASEAFEASLTDPRGSHGFQRLKGDVGAATLESVLDAADRLAFIQGLDLPFDMMSSVDPSWIKILVRRVEGETAYEVGRHKREKRLGLLAIQTTSRRAKLIDGLVDLLIEVVHRIGTKSRRKVIGK